MQDTCYQMKRGQDKNWSPNRVADRYDLANRNETVCSWLPKDGNDPSLLSICNEERSTILDILQTVGYKASIWFLFELLRVSIKENLTYDTA